jgi:hypothetical protein
MNRLIRLVRRMVGWWRAVVFVFPLPAVAVAPTWTATDKGNWAHFLASNTGRKLLARARAVEAFNAINRSKSVVTIEHLAGRTCGWSECIAWFVSLSNTSERAKEEQSTDEAAEKRLIESLKA